MKQTYEGHIEILFLTITVTPDSKRLHLNKKTIYKCDFIQL